MSRDKKYLRLVSTDFSSYVKYFTECEQSIEDEHLFFFQNDFLKSHIKKRIAVYTFY